MLLPALMVGGLGTGLFNPAVSAVALGSAPPEQSGLAAGVNDTFRQAGIAVGVALFGALIPGSAALGKGSAESFVTGMHTALIVGAVLAAIGAIACVRLIPVRRAGAQVEQLPGARRARRGRRYASICSVGPSWGPHCGKPLRCRRSRPRSCRRHATTMAKPPRHGATGAPGETVRPRTFDPWRTAYGRVALRDDTPARARARPPEHSYPSR